MALTAHSLQTALAAALAESAAIADLCLTYFDAPHRVSAGGSGRQGQTEAPAFAVVAWNRTAGEDDDNRAIEMSVLLSISDDSIATVTKTVTIDEDEKEDTQVSVILETFGGPAKLEALLDLAVTELLAISSEIMITDLQYSFEPLEFYPLFIGGLDFTVTIPVLIGGYEPTIS